MFRSFGYSYCADFSQAPLLAAFVMAQDQGGKFTASVGAFPALCEIQASDPLEKDS